MKKLIVFISMLAVALSCETMYGPEQTPLKADKAGAITITVNEVKDSTASFTLTPEGAASYFSYLVDESEATGALDSAALFACQYEGISQGTFKWTEETVSQVVELKGLLPNTTYQIYAVVASPMGFVSSVVSKSFKTSDALVPELDLEACEVADTLVTLEFSEDVVLAENARIEALYYALNDPAFAERTHVGAMPADTVIVEGNVVTLEFRKLPKGAYYAVNYPAGTFKDAAGNPAAELKSLMMNHPEGGPIGAGVYGQVANVKFELAYAAEEPITMVKDVTAPIMLTVPETVVPAKGDAKAVGSIVYEAEGATHIYDLVYGQYNFAWTEGGVYVIPNLHPDATGRPDPERGNNVVITIAEGALVDLYGNVNAEFELDPMLYSYGFTVADVCGVWENDGTSAYQGVNPENPWNFVVEASDDAEKGNVMITSFYGFDGLKIYAAYDGDLGTLTFPTKNLFLGEFVQKGYQYYKVNEAGTDYIKDNEGAPVIFTNDVYFAYYTKGYYGDTNTLYMTDPDNITDGEDFIGYIYQFFKMPESGKVEDITPDLFEGSGQNLFRPVFTKKTSDAGTAPAPASRTMSQTLGVLKLAE